LLCYKNKIAIKTLIQISSQTSEASETSSLLDLRVWRGQLQFGFELGCAKSKGRQGAKVFK